MSDLGPLPEQRPEPDWRIPLLDLRDRIRLDHEVEPLSPFGKEVHVERQRLRREAEQRAKASNQQMRQDFKQVILPGLVSVAILFTWFIKPVVVIVLVLICVILIVAARK